MSPPLTLDHPHFDTSGQSLAFVGGVTSVGSSIFWIHVIEDKHLFVIINVLFIFAPVKTLVQFHGQVCDVTWELNGRAHGSKD